MLNRTCALSIFSGLLLSMLLSSLIFINAHALSLPPRLSADMYASDDVFGQANALLPVSGDAHRALYLNPQVAYGADGQGYLDLGLGYRWLHNCNALWGVYLFGGYSKVADEAHLWTVNPGMEILGRRWEAQINAYLASRRKQSLGYWFGYEVNRKHLQFRGHQVYDDLYFIRQHRGHGLDAQVSYQPWGNIPLKASMGSYFFAPDEVKNVVGGVVGLEYWLDSHFKLLVNYNYDNVRRSIGSIGLGIELGGTRHHHTAPQCIQERITDPVKRNLAQQGQGSAVITQNTHFFLGPHSLTNRQFDEANRGEGGWGPDPGEPGEGGPPPVELPPEETPAYFAFFSATGLPNGGPLDPSHCTVESPCGPNDFTQENINFMQTYLPGTRFRVSQGTYDAYGVGATDLMTLNSGQSVNGETVDYAHPASNAERPVFNGGFILTGENTLANIILLPSASANADLTGVQALNARGVLITQTSIGTLANRYTGTGSRAAVESTGSELDINQSQIYAGIYTSGQKRGVRINTSSLVFNDSLIDVIGNGGVTGLSASASQAQLNSGWIKVTGATSTGDKIGVNTLTGSIVGLNNMDINVGMNTAGVFNIFLSSIENLPPNITIVEGGTLTLNSNNGTGFPTLRFGGENPDDVQFSNVTCFREATLDPGCFP